MEVVNDNTCSWINDLSPRNNIKTLSFDLDCEWLIVGAGYTGLSAARKLGTCSNTIAKHPNFSKDFASFFIFSWVK